MSNQTTKVSDIQLVPIKPKDGLVAFASIVLDEKIYIGSIGIYTKIDGGYRITYPTKKLGDSNIPIVHPINEECGEAITNAIINKFNVLFNKPT